MLDDLKDALTGRARQRERELRRLQDQNCPPQWDDREGPGKWCQPQYDRTRYPAELPERSHSVFIPPDVGRNRLWIDQQPPDPAELASPRWGGLGGTLDRTPDITNGELYPHSKFMAAGEFPWREGTYNPNLDTSNSFMGVGPVPFMGSGPRQGLGDASAQRLEMMTGARGPFNAPKRAIEKSHPRNRQNAISQGADLASARQRGEGALSKFMDQQLPFQQVRDTGVRTMPFGGAPLQPELRVLPYEVLEPTQHLVTGFQNIPSHAQANPNTMYQTGTSWQPLTRANFNDLTHHRVPVPGRDETLQAPKQREHFEDRQTQRQSTQVGYSGHAALAQGEISGVPIAAAATEAKQTLRPWTEALPQHGAPSNQLANGNQLAQAGWDPRETLRQATAQLPYMGSVPTNPTANANALAQAGWDPRATLHAATQDNPYMGSVPTNPTANANALVQAGWDPRATLHAATQDNPYMGQAPSNPTANANTLAQAGWDPRETLKAATQDLPYLGQAPSNTTANANAIAQAGWDPRATLKAATQDVPHAGAAPSWITDGGHVISHATTDAKPTLRLLTQDAERLGSGPARDTSSANEITQAGWDPRSTLRMATQDNPQAGAGPAFPVAPGHQIALATTEAKPTLRIATEDNPQLGGPAGYEHAHADQTEWWNWTTDDRKEIGTFNRMAGADRNFNPSYQINVMLKPEDCNDYTRTANLEVAQYSNMRSMPTIQVPNDKYTDEWACYAVSPIQTEMLKHNPFVNDVRRAFVSA